jgi:hypothetical protein
VQTGEILVNKLAAAQRQLDAAIRLFLMSEDELAIHTIGSAAHRILRDIMASRGTSAFAFGMAAGLFYVAKELLSGRIKEIPEGMQDYERLIDRVKQWIKEGHVGSREDLQDVLKNYFTIQEKEFWKFYNRGANYLKHANQDSEKLLPVKDLNNEELLQAASVMYFELMGRMTPEMEVICLYLGQFPEGDDEYLNNILTIPPAQRRRNCLKILREMKSGRRGPIWAPRTRE